MAHAQAYPVLEGQYFHQAERGVTEFSQPIHVQSHLEMPGILVQLGRIQHT